MTNTITFRWNTGKIELAACTIPSMTAAQLSALVKTATANAEEVKQQIAEYINEQITFYDEKTERGKKSIEQLKKLLSAAVGERKQTAQEKAIARIIKNCSRAQFTGVFENAGKYCILDGYRMVRYSTPLESFPKAPDSLDTERAIGDKSRYNIPLNLPTVKEIKADIKLARIGYIDVGRIHVSGRGRSMSFKYDFGYGLPLVDAEFLIDMLDALPNAAAYAIDKSSGIYFTDGENDGLLLPCHKTQEYEDPAPVAVAVPVEEKPVDTAPVEVPVNSEAKINQIDAPLENRQVYGYKPDGNTVTAHRWKVCHLTGDLYLQQPYDGQYGQRFAHVVLIADGVKIGLDVDTIGNCQLDHSSIADVEKRIGFSTLAEFNACVLSAIESNGYIKNSYIAFVRQYDGELAQRMEDYKTAWTARREQEETERRAEIDRKEEQQRIEREQAISEKLARAEKAIINGGHIENEMLDSKLLFLRLFDKYGVKLAIRSRGWVIDKLKSIVQYNDGHISVYFSRVRDTDKSSHGFVDAYFELRDLLIDAQEAVENVPAAVPVEQVAPVATSAPVDATQAAETVETVQSVVAVHPALLRYSGRLYKLSATADIAQFRGRKPSRKTRLCVMNNAFFLNSS